MDHPRPLSLPLSISLSLELKARKLCKRCLNFKAFHILIRLEIWCVSYLINDHKMMAASASFGVQVAVAAGGISYRAGEEVIRCGRGGNLD